jgi:glycosyltransferase involved in cell wall biosynthesis
MENNKIKIMHLTNSLMVNGRTTLMLSLIEQTRDKFIHEVVTLKFAGKLSKKFREISVPVYTMSAIANGWPKMNILKMPLVVKNLKPDICITWSGAAKLISPFIKIYDIPIVWTIHNSLEKFDNKIQNIFFSIVKKLSRIVPNKIVCCSSTTHDVYQKIHRFPSKKLLTISNCVDTNKFRPTLDKRKLREKLRLRKNIILVASATWFDYEGKKDDIKGIKTLIKAAGITTKKNFGIHYILFGHGLDKRNSVLLEWINEVNAENCISLLGVRHDVPDLFAASDIVTVSSNSGEGFPLAILEGMATGSIPVCTDSGELKNVVGPVGVIVKPGDSNGLAEAITRIAKLTERERKEISEKVIKIVKNRYSINSFSEKYYKLIFNLVEEKKRKRSGDNCCLNQIQERSGSRF